MATPACRWMDKATCTDVVIVGNGPSAITLSFLLHGYRPYYNGNTHSNTLLTSKLQDSKSSLVEQDLEFLSEGLEGRSPNPVALLWDALMHPDADLGVDNPPLLSWKYEKSKALSHVVLGKMKAGGSWQRMEGTMQTLSQNGWMELPGLSFRQWLAQRQRKLDFISNRATTGDVRDYYEEYVDSKGLKEHFRDFHVVTSVQKVFYTRNGADCESGEVEPCCQNIRQNHHFLWEVRGYRILGHSTQSSRDSEEAVEGRRESDEEKASADNSSSSCSTEDLTNLADDASLTLDREDFCYVTPRVVLATGTYDIPNRLGIHGENFPSVIHSLCALERRLSDNDLTRTSAPICVVGAGLSAADAILMALEAGLPVMHVFRCGPSDPNLIFRKLPQTIYPEYHRVAMLMKGQEEHELYQAYPRHRLVEIGQQMVLLKPSLSRSSPSRSPSPPGSDQSIVSIDVSLTVIMIGSRPDLSFLNGGGRTLGLVPKWPIDSKHNPVDVDPFSYQSIHEPGLFALGPLIGDNFVRFGIGGALGIMNYLCTKEEGLNTSQ